MGLILTQSEFVDQINRLRIRFGAKAFDQEFVKILGREVSMLPFEHFRQTVDTWIGTRKNNNPPLLTDFRECKIAHDKRKFDVVVKDAAKTFHYGLKDVLRKHYNVDSLAEAMELERLKLRLNEKA